MLTHEANQQLTRIGPGTLMGALMRGYWLPLLFSHELAADGEPQRVRLLGEDLIAYRDSNGAVGVIAGACPHRGASLFFGRNEEGGLRCVYHGWKFDTAGSCVDMPNEPAESNFKHKIRATAYKAVDFGGVIFCYMGPDQATPPGLPQFEWALVPENQRHLQYHGIRQCNWMQALEGDIDTSHLYFLHGRLNAQDPPAYGVFHKDKSPRLEVMDTEYGVLYGARREEAPGEAYWRTTQFMFPIFVFFPAQEDGTVPGHIWVPLDDEHTMQWGVQWHPFKEIANRGPRDGLGKHKAYQHGAMFANAWPEAERQNDFLMDREEQRTKNYTGISTIPLQDAAMTVGMGAIMDRTKEHLATSDAMIISVRRRLIRAAQALAEHGKTPPCIETPELYKVRSCSVTLPAGLDWREALADWHNARIYELPKDRIDPNRSFAER